MQNNEVKFNSNINVLGGFPDYANMVRYVVDKINDVPDTDFSFRTEKSVKRFIAGIHQDVILFKNQKHQDIIIDAFSSENLLIDQKLLVLFWHLCVNNRLFAIITEDYFMKSVYSGRVTLRPEEILSLLYELRRQYPDELKWSDTTLKITASKYLTMLKKLGLATGKQIKKIRYPTIGDEVFVILVRLALVVYPDDPSEQNPLFKFSFLEQDSLLNRLKAIKFTPYWNITQLGNNIKIELHHE